MGNTTDAKTKVVNTFQDLIKTVYSNLRMLGTSLIYSEDTLKNTIRSRQDDLFGTDDQTISEAESEILNFINRRKKQSDRTSLIDLRNHFSKKPFGWYPNAIWSVTAKLYKRGKIEVKQDSNLLEDADFLNALLNSSNYSNTLLEPQTEIDQSQVKKLKQVYSEAFDENCNVKEGKDVANAFKGKLKGMFGELNQLLARKNEYPFLSALSDFNEKLKRWSNKEYTYYLTNLKDFEDELLDTKEDLIDPIKRFINGDQITIYDSIRNLLNGDTSNLEYIEGNELDTLKDLMNNSKPFKGDAIKNAKQAMDVLTKKVLDQIDHEKSSAIQAIEESIKKLKEKEDYSKLKDSQQSSIVEPLEAELTKVSNSKYIANLRDVKTRVTDTIYTNQLNEMSRLTMPESDSEDGEVSEPKVHYIKKTNVPVQFHKSELKSESDVDEYVETLRKALKEQIKSNRRIEL